MPPANRVSFGAGAAYERVLDCGDDVFVDALQKTKGNRTRAAEVLEVSHRALPYKIKDYKIIDL